MRMRKILMLITSVRVKIQLNFKNVHWTVFEGEYYGTNEKFLMAEIKRMRMILMPVTSLRVKIQLNL